MAHWKNWWYRKSEINCPTLLKASFQISRMPILRTCDVADKEIEAVSQIEAANGQKKGRTCLKDNASEMV